MSNTEMKLSWGLFNAKWYHIFTNIHDLFIYIKRIFFLIKHGYPPFAEWDTDIWFIHTMKPILLYHRYNRMGTPWILKEQEKPGDHYQESLNETEYNNVLDRMIVLLDSMNTWDKIYEDKDYKEIKRLTKEASTEFFRMFNLYFYDLYD